MPEMRTKKEKNKTKREQSSNESHEQSMVNDPFDADVAIFDIEHGNQYLVS